MTHSYTSSVHHEQIIRYPPLAQQNQKEVALHRCNEELASREGSNEQDNHGEAKFLKIMPDGACPSFLTWHCSTVGL